MKPRITPEQCVDVATGFDKKFPDSAREINAIAWMLSDESETRIRLGKIGWRLITHGKTEN